MKQTVIIVYVSMLLFANSVLSQSIRFRCIQVNDTADAVLYWQSNSLPATYQYKIYTSQTLTGTYLFLDSITNILTDTFVHKNAHANLQQNFYYIQACPLNGNTSLPIYTSDTLENIWLALDNQSTGIAFLFWQYPNRFDINDSFHIERRFNSSWEIMQLSHQVAYNDTITFCGRTPYYQVTYDNGSGCKNISAKVSDFFTDFIAPEIAVLDTVSINPITKKTEMGWERSSSKDTYGYIIYFFKDGIWKTLDTLFGAENTFYIDAVNSANSISQQYRIAAIDTCLNASPLGNEHQTLFVSASTKKCDSIVSLQWNNYLNMPNGVDSFRIFASRNGGSFTILDCVKATDLKYDYKHVNTADDFQFFIQAFNFSNGFTSTSNIISVTFNRIIGNGNVWMRYVSVKDNKYIEIAAYVNDTVVFNTIYLFKSIDSGKTFSYYNKQAKSSESESYMFADDKVKVGEQVYYYTFSLTDECDIPFISSDTAHNIVLQEGNSELQSNAIRWNFYKHFPSCVDGYDVYRKTQIQTNYTLLSTESSSTNSFTENVFGMAEEGAVFSYKVVAMACNWLSFNDESVSNTLEIRKKDTLYIPNAFYPNSDYEDNKIFKPVCVFIDADNYEFKIYNRWGNEVFSTTNINEGWDGTYNGNMSPLGVYTYSIRYNVNENSSKIRRGTVVLLH